MRFFVRHAGWFLGLGTYLAIYILLPDVDMRRRAVGSVVLSVTILIAIAGWEYDE